MIYNLKTLISCPPQVFNPEPIFSWSVSDLFHTKRYRLYAHGTETPYFVDCAKTTAHRYHPEYKVSLWGSGMGETITRLDGSTYQIAGFKGAFHTIKEGKDEAIKLTMRKEG